MNLTDVIDDDPDLYEDWEENDWEDSAYLKNVQDRLPGWHLIKLEEFNHNTFGKVRPWLKENVRYGQYEELGWSSGCSYSVGVAFESGKDAMLFKLRWY